MSGVLVALVLVVLCLGLLLWAGSGKTVIEKQGSGIIEAVPNAWQEEPDTPATLHIVSYCMAYGLSPRHPLARETATAVYDRLDAIIDMLAASSADVIVLQEVDFASQRSHNMDQLSYIAAALGWGFVARALTWECRYLPFPWQHAGRIRAGQGIISRYPLLQNTRQRLSQSRQQPLWSSLFAPYHTVQCVDIQCGARLIRLFNVHLDARDAGLRQRQAQEVVTFVGRNATPNSVLIGAFNSPLASTRSADIPISGSPDQTMDSICTHLRNHLRLPSSTPTFGATSATNFYLDHALVGPGLQVIDIQRLGLPSTGTGHAPLLVVVQWSLPLS